MLSSGMNVRSIAKKYNIRPDLIYDMKQGLIHKQFYHYYKGPNRKAISERLREALEALNIFIERNKAVLTEYNTIKTEVTRLKGIYCSDRTYFEKKHKKMNDNK